MYRVHSGSFSVPVFATQLIALAAARPRDPASFISSLRSTEVPRRDTIRVHIPLVLGDYHRDKNKDKDKDKDKDKNKDKGKDKGKDKDKDKDKDKGKDKSKSKNKNK